MSPIASTSSNLTMAGGPNLNGLGTNYTAGNKWIAYVPLQNALGNKYRNLDLHVKSFSIPQMEQTTSEVSFRGYTKTIPTKVINADTKEFTIEYIIDEHWFNYKSLYAWMGGIVGSYPQVTDDATESISASDLLTIRVYLLDNYKNKVIEFVFENCFIKTFNDLRLEASNSNEVTGSITLCYDRFSIANTDTSSSSLSSTTA